MSATRIEEIFKVTGVPGLTFVEPSAFSHLQVALRTPGRGVIVEGPSGIGKSTAVAKALQAIDQDPNVTRLSARVAADVEYIELLDQLGDVGIVIIDDFHRLDESTKAVIADLLKVSADAEYAGRTLVLIGINEAGKTLIDSSPDLTNRIDVIRFEVEPDSKIEELVSLGEREANVELSAHSLIVENAKGSFYIAQLLCLEACLQAKILEAQQDRTQVEILYSSHRFLGEDVEAYLGPIYASGSRYVVAVLGEMYGRKRWTLFEAAAYKHRIEAGRVLPIWSKRVPPTPFDETRGLGGLDYEPNGDLLAQAKAHAEVISKKLADS
ncbi:MAG: hypothetical protein DLM58_01600 [Pseudonocardiales bacterium]|nr:MAG: hypothetical protein DLM58_01600 [Pseudonocardiales bacterium]